MDDFSKTNLDLTREHLSLLNAFAVRLFSVQSEELLAWSIARDVVGKLGFPDCVVYYADTQSGSIKQKAAIGVKNPREHVIENALEIPLGRGITGNVAITGRAEIIHDLADDARYIPDLNPARSEICVPIWVNGAVFGVIDCEDPRPAHFTDTDLELLNNIATIAAGRLEVFVRDREIRKQEALLQTILENSPCNIVIKDANGKILDLNAEGAKEVGLSREAATGNTTADLMPAHIASAYMEADRKVVATGNPVEQEVVEEYGDHTRYFYSSKFPLKDGEGKVFGICSISNEITSIREAEEELRKALDRAAHASRAKSSFLANLSHELRTPLNAIIGLASMMEHMEPKNIPREKATEYLGDIQRSGEHLLHMINEVIDLSKIEEDRIELDIRNLKIEELIDDAIKVMSVIGEPKNVRIEKRSIAGNALGDRQSVHQVLINILNNAIKYSPPSSLIQISTASDSDRLRISIDDQGSGIPQSVINHLGEPFLRGTSPDVRNIEGSGLGLAISNRLLERQNGTLGLERRLEGGTRASIFLPAIEAVSAPPDC